MGNLIFSCIESRIEDNQTLYGCFKLGPFYSNQGLTIANTLRRLLLSDLEGLAVVFVKMEGVNHEYSIVSGVKESVLEILANLKQIQFKTNSIIYKPQVAYLNIRGPKIILADDIQLPSQIECVDPTQYIATISSDGNLKIKIFICQGKRYCLQNSLKPVFQKHYRKMLDLKSSNYLFLDAIFLPIRQVNFTIEQNNKLNKEFIIFEIWTKGGAHPKQSLFKAINEVFKILIPFRKFYSLQKVQTPKYLAQNYLNIKNLKNSNREYQNILSKIESAKFQKKLFTLDISNLNLLISTYIFLKKANIHTISDLLKKSKAELSLLDGFDNELLYDIEKNIINLGLNLKK
nr:RNA polymerase alpha subunit [Ostreobium quekettii]